MTADGLLPGQAWAIAPGPTCVVVDCGGAVKRCGMCYAHYKRLIRYGDPMGGGPKKAHGRSVEQRADEMTDKSGGADSCWLWTGCVTNGYGAIRLDSKKVYAHRVAWEAANGKIPNGMFVCHHCDNRLCVNPSHMFIGTHDDNMRDCKDKGRTPRGESNGQAKLSSASTLSILGMRASGMKQADIAAEFGVSVSLIGSIESGKIWSHVTGVVRNA